MCVVKFAFLRAWQIMKGLFSNYYVFGFAFAMSGHGKIVS